MHWIARLNGWATLMADNTTLDGGSGGDTIRTEDRTTYKTPVSLLDVGGTSAEALIGDSGVAMPVRGLAAEDAAASGNPVPAGGRYDATPRTLDDGDRGEVALDAAGNVVESNSAAVKAAVEIMGDWDESDRAKVNLIASQAGISAGDGTVAANTPRVTLATDQETLTNLFGQVAPAASAVASGTSTFYDADLDETKQEVTDNATVRIYSIVAFNTTDAPLFLQLFDLDADNVTVGTTTPTNQYVIPGNADSDGAGFVISFPVPKAYSTGFTVACTTDSQGSSAPGTGACIVNIEYVSAA